MVSSDSREPTTQARKERRRCMYFVGSRSLRSDLAQSGWLAAFPVVSSTYSCGPVSYSKSRAKSVVE